MYSGRTLKSRLDARRGFTLVELLTVVSLIAVLIAILLPALARARSMARRVEDLSNLKQLSAICIMYAGENRGFLPVGRRNTFVSDDYVWFNDATWLELQSWGASDSIGACTNIRDSDGFTTYGQPISTAPGDTYLGWIYWGGRQNIPDDFTQPTRYISPKRIGPVDTNSSQTLWTCLCFDSVGQPWNSFAPHVKDSLVIYPTGMTPPPEGLAVSRVDGSAAWVPFGALTPIRQADEIYYQAD